MKNLIYVVMIAFVFTACSEKSPDKVVTPDISHQENSDMEKRKIRDKCILENRINNTNIDCNEKSGLDSSK